MKRMKHEIKQIRDKQTNNRRAGSLIGSLPAAPRPVLTTCHLLTRPTYYSSLHFFVHGAVPSAEFLLLPLLSPVRAHLLCPLALLTSTWPEPMATIAFADFFLLGSYAQGGSKFVGDAPSTNIVINSFSKHNITKTK